jgi:hypothetical protein
VQWDSHKRNVEDLAKTYPAELELVERPWIKMPGIAAQPWHKAPPKFADRHKPVR